MIKFVDYSPKLITMINIKKRDGTLVPYDKSKIVNAIQKAFDSCNFFIAEPVILDLANKVSIWNGITVEDIQDQVEEILMSYDYPEVAKEYILYRKDREILRKKNDSLMKRISEKLNAVNVQNQNANVDEGSFGGRVGEASRIVTKEYALNYCMSEMSKNNHLNNEIYIHDLDNYAIGTHNCLTIPIDDLLKKGFTTRQADIRPPSTVNTAFQLLAVIMQLQSLCQFGGVAYSHLDWSLVPYVRKSFFKHFKVGMGYLENHKYPFYDQTGEESIEDESYKSHPRAYDYALEMTKKEVYQGAEAFYHNLGTLQSRSGNQLPFSSINFGTCTLLEGRLVIEALLNASIDGIGKFHKTPIFPCSIFQLGIGINRHPGDPNYDLFQLALKSTAQRLYPNYANIDWSGNAGYDKSNPCTYFSTMGCRTSNGYDINGFGQLKDGRGNICPVTIIMPTIAMEAKRDPDKFLKLLDKKIHEAKDMLIERFQHIASQPASAAKFMYDNGTMAGYVPEEGIISALKHGTLAIGNLGLAETLELLLGCNHTNSKGMEFAKKIYSLFNKRCKEFKETYKLNFGVYNSPAENLCYTSMQKFKEKYGIIPKVSDKEFFTNSMHVPVWEKVSVKQKIDLESQLTSYSNAGCITYIELPETAKNNLEALEDIVNYAMDKDIPYFAINLPNDTCDDCGYQDEIPNECPQCGSNNIKRLRRVTGYLSGDYKSAFNKGKQQEVEMRVKHVENS